jgi:ribonuclease HI
MADKEIIMAERVKVNCDGGSRGNPGPSAYGVVIAANDGQIIEEFGAYLGEQTNNYAEYSGVVAALEKLKDLNIFEADFYLDSELIVKQLNGVYKVKNPGMIELNSQVKELSKGMDLSFTHVYRKDNKLADAIVNEVLDSNR